MTTYISVGSIVAHSDLSSTDINNIFTNINKYFNGTNTWDAFILGSLTISGNLTSTTLTVSSSITLNSLTASRVVQSNSSKQLESSSVTTTELGYLSGVTSSIQTQFSHTSPLSGSTSITTLGTITTGTWNGNTIGVAYGGTGTGALTQGSIPFAGASGVFSQDNSSFFWDNTNKRLGIGTNAPDYKLHVIGTVRISGRLVGHEVFCGDDTNDAMVRWTGPNNWEGYLNNSLDYWSLRRNSTELINVSSNGDLYSITYTDYSSTSTLTGWSSTTTKQIYYKKIGKLVLIEFYISGTSNATTTNFTVPSTIYPTATRFCVAHCIDSGGSTIGFGLLSTSGQFDFTVSDVYTLSSWTNSGTKSIRGYIMYHM